MVSRSPQWDSLLLSKKKTKKMMMMKRSCPCLCFFLCSIYWICCSCWISPCPSFCRASPLLYLSHCNPHLRVYRDDISRRIVSCFWMICYFCSFCCPLNSVLVHASHRAPVRSPAPVPFVGYRPQRSHLMLVEIAGVVWWSICSA